MLARKRHVAGLPDILRTPLLVPSFSSKSGTNRRYGKVEVDRLSEIVTSPVLISAYDLFHGLAEVPAYADALFLDSGGYEALRDVLAADLGNRSGVERYPWSEESYAKVLADIGRSPRPVVAVSFDHPGHPAPLAKQMDRADRLFPQGGSIIREFLIKAEPLERYVDIGTLLQHVERLATYPIIGLTDKELGGTMMERLLCVARLRKALDRIGSQVPIHVFGSLDPVTAPLYFLAGADVFDGLAWLRYGFSNGRAVYPQNFEAIELDLHQRPGSGQFAMWTKNFLYLVRLEDDMRRFLRQHQFSCFGPNAEVLERAWSNLDESWRERWRHVRLPRRPGARDLQSLALEDAAVAAFQTRLSELLGGLLATYNDRDYALAARRLEPIAAALREEHSGPFDQLFGGSVAKHTYVDGLSDVDCLIVINGSGLHGEAPPEAIGRMAEVVRRVAAGASVEAGRMAITARYPDGMELQLLPAVDDGGGRLRVPSAGGTEWSKINPQTFRAVLTRRNEQCGGKLVPTIKLAKAILASLPEGLGVSGYHVESLAIEAFRGYDGVRTTAAMLPLLFQQARVLVLEPMRDATGQSVHVDGDLGPPQSASRQEASFAFGRIARQMRTASAAGSIERWLGFFGLAE